VDERRTSPVELLWDLVFVFAVTQVAILLREHLSWGGFGESMLVLALVWWAWSAFVWVLNAQREPSRTVTLTLLVAMGVIFVAGVALPQAFGSRAVLFSASYAVVRFMHLGLYAYESRIGNADWRSIAGFAITVAIGMLLLLGGAFTHGGVRIGLWTAALAIGSGARPLSTGRVAAVVLCLLIIVTLWWAYFDELAEAAEERLREHEDAVLAAADAYSYIHVLIVAGIIVFAVGARLLVHTGNGPLSAGARLALCGGVSMYISSALPRSSCGCWRPRSR
jgi:low temperature requirement protein LtrA